MSINPLGVAAYTKTELVKPLQQNTASKTNEASQTPVGAESAKQGEAAEKIRAPRREAETSSALAVRSKLDAGAFAEVMTPEEREALELLFEKYQDRLDQTSGYSAAGRETDSAQIGARIDYRV